ncbi:MAG TPA: DUF1800 domain-containing protein [Solirubrobacteraceae bacterium]|jgi:hypothetical protein|nr:DUF1800 domain-containing protein [Solirubrobacteraceae bacterium]
MKTSLATKKHAGGTHSHAGRDEQRRRAKEHEKHHEKHSSHSKRHKRRRKRHKPPVHRRVVTPHGTIGVALALPPVSPPAPSSAPPPTLGSPPITLQQANRLLWRAGFGPTPGQAEALVGQPLQQVVFGLTRPSGSATLTGPEPIDEEGEPLDPANAWGQDHCWWLDRMVRSDQQLVERMTFVLHDWFANSNDQVNSQQLMLDQNNLFRSMAFGSFDDLFLAVTANPAMLLFLNGTSNSKDEPNENYAREMMELFSLGADRGAYTEDDVREMARALTGWRNEWSAELGSYNFHFDPEYHDTGQKTVFGQTGNWNYEDAVRLCVSHPLHASFFVTKLWGYFVASQPSEATLASLQGLYTSSDYSIQAVVEAILQHPDFYEGPELVTPPVVYNAGLLRSISRPIDTTAWAWLSANAGQQLFYPPNVSGWDFTRWLDTSTAKARWEMASYVTSKTYPNPWPAEGQPEYSATEDPATALSSALAYWANPILSSESEQCIAAFAQSCLKEPLAEWEQSPYRAMRQNALRMLIATSPDMQVS